MVHSGTPPARNGRRTHRPELRSHRGEWHKTPLASSPESGSAGKGHFHSFCFSQPRVTNSDSSLHFKKGVVMSAPATIGDYLRAHGQALGELVLARFPALHAPEDPVWPALQLLKRWPFPAQAMAIMGVVKRWQEARCAAVVAECGTGKTLISLGSVVTHANARPFTCLAMAPPQLVEKWCREAILTLPGIRVFIIDGCRNGLASNGFAGVNEVRLRHGRIVREGLKTTLSDMRLARQHRSAKARWQQKQVAAPSLIVVSRERGKLSYFWRHAYGSPRSGPFAGSIVNPDTGRPVVLSEDQLRRSDFRKVKIAETVLPESDK